MDGIDISNYQAGIDLSKVPCDFVLILVSEGGSIVNPYWRRQADQALSLGKLVGLYHYVAGSGAGEVDTFVNATRDYRGRVVMALDWESGQNSQWGNTGYLDTLIKRLKQSVSTVLLYGSSGSFPRQVASANGCPTWVAQYASMSATGYQGSPWNEGAYQADIRQYASTGRMSGWGGNLDLNKYYGTRDQWSKWAGNGDDDMTQPIDVWNYELGTDAKSGYQNNPAWVHLSWAHHDTAKLVQMLCRTDDAGLKDGTNGDMYTRICWIDKRIRDMTTTITALSTALETVSKAVGADPETIAQAVQDAVTAKLNAVTIQMNVKGN